MPARSPDADWALPPPGPPDVELDGTIADEIADHLAAAAAEYGAAGLNAGAARRAALSDFGDPAFVVTQVRTIHMRGRIMFQRITIATLLVLTAAIGLTAYFSYAGTQSMAAELRELNTKLKALAERYQVPPPKSDLSVLAERLDGLGRPAHVRAPRLRVLVYEGSKDRPMAGVPISISGTWGIVEGEGKTRFTRSFETDSNGIVDPVRMPRGRYEISATVDSVAGGDPKAGEGTMRWSTKLDLIQDGQQEHVEIDLGLPRPRARLVASETCSWDLDALPLAYLTIRLGPYHISQWIDPRQPFQLLGLPEGATGLAVAAAGWPRSSPEHATVWAPVSPPASSSGASGELLLLKLQPGKRNKNATLAGHFYHGSPDNPAEGMAIRLLPRPTNGVDDRLPYIHLRTLENGRFGVSATDAGLAEIPIAGFEVPLRRSLSRKSRGPVRVDVDLDRVVRLTARIAAPFPRLSPEWRYGSLALIWRGTSAGEPLESQATVNSVAEGAEVAVPAVLDGNTLLWYVSIGIERSQGRSRSPWDVNGWAINADSGKDFVIPLTYTMRPPARSDEWTVVDTPTSRPGDAAPIPQLTVNAGEVRMVEVGKRIRSVVGSHATPLPRFEIIAPDRLKVLAPASLSYKDGRGNVVKQKSIQARFLVLTEDEQWQRYELVINSAETGAKSPG